MSGLLERAQTLVLKKGGGRALSPPPDETEESGITPDERRELVAQIESLFTEHRPIENLKIGRRRGGVAFPLYVNLAAAVVLVAAVFVVNYLPGRLTGEQRSESGNYLTTEGLVVQRVKQQAEAQLSASQQRIAEIKRELATLQRSSAADSGAVADAAARARQQKLEAELANLQSSTNTTNTRLANLQAQQMQQTFLIRQLQSLYQNVGSDVSAGNIDGALSGISSAEQLLKEKSTTGSEVASVAPALYAGNAVLRAALEFGQTAMKAAAASDLTAKMAAIEHSVSQGDASYSAGDLNQARADYTKAIETLNGVSHAYARLDAMTAAEVKRRVDGLTAEINQLKADVVKMQTRVTQQAAELGKQQETMANQQAQIGKQQVLISEQASTIAQEKLSVQKKTEELSAVVLGVQRSLNQSGPSKNGQLDSKEMLDLLKTKVELRSLADTPEARKAYPDLASQVDGFFKKYADTYSRQGQSAAMNQVASALNDIILSLNLKLQNNGSNPPSTATPVSMLDISTNGS